MSCCVVQLCCWICLISLSIVFIGFALTLWEGMTTEPTFCSRAQLLLGAECAQKTRKLEDALLKVNKTVRFLRPPSEYRLVTELCNKTQHCLNGINCEDGHDFVQDVRETLPACDFYQFYTEEFRECAEQLILKASNESCLDTLFNAKHVIRFNRCQQWRDIQPCVHDAIASECDGNATTLAYRFTEVASDFYRGMNCEPREQRIETRDIDYEIIEMSSS